jgi:hypothetical protein
MINPDENGHVYQHREPGFAELMCDCGAFQGRGELYKQPCPRAGKPSVDEPKGFSTELIAKLLVEIEFDPRNGRADRRLVQAAAERLLALETALGLAPEIVEQLKMAGSWDLPTLTRVGELMASLVRDAARPKSP